MSQKTLIAYFSKGGAASKYAHAIAETLEEKGFPVDEVDLHTNKAPDLNAYDNVIIGTGVRIGVVYRMGKRILRRNELKDKRLAVFLASGIAVEDHERAKKRFLEPLLRRFNLRPMAFEAFPGMLPGDGGQLTDCTKPKRAQVWAAELADQLVAADSQLA